MATHQTSPAAAGSTGPLRSTNPETNIMKTVKNRRIYLASSWRNPYQPEVLAALRAAGHDVYDFRNPAPGQKGFAWRDCGGIAAQDGPGTGAKTIPSYLEAVHSSRAAEGFAFDKAALEWCDTCVLALPCGRSAHLELGYAAGQGKDTYVLLHEDKFEPELMYLLNTGISSSIEEIISWMAMRQPGSISRWHEESGGHFAKPSGHAVRLLREVTELCVAAGASTVQIADAVLAEIKKSRDRGEIGGDAAAVPKEWADCAILMKVIAAHLAIPESGVVRDKLDILWEREWEPDESGALYRASVSNGARSPLVV